MLSRLTGTPKCQRPVHHVTRPTEIACVQCPAATSRDHHSPAYNVIEEYCLKSTIRFYCHFRNGVINQAANEMLSTTVFTLSHLNIRAYLSKLNPLKRSSLDGLGDIKGRQVRRLSEFLSFRWDRSFFRLDDLCTGFASFNGDTLL